MKIQRALVMGGFTEITEPEPEPEPEPNAAWLFLEDATWWVAYAITAAHLAGKRHHRALRALCGGGGR